MLRVLLRCHRFALEAPHIGLEHPGEARRRGVVGAGVGPVGARVEEALAKRRGAQDRLRKLELQIRFEVETAVSEIASALERIQTAETAVGQAEESFRIMKEKYELGKGTMTDVLDAQSALVTAETSQTRALADLAIAYARLKLAVGDMMP